MPDKKNGSEQKKEKPVQGDLNPIEPDKWQTRGLLAHIEHLDSGAGDRRFAFILGSGASRTSGIKTGAELVDDWLNELQERYDPKFGKRPLKEWATEQTLGIPGFNFEERDRSYSEVYKKRFGDDPAEGFAALERLMEGKKPSFGYAVLAQILAKGRHNVVITTNFDNLVGDALFICGGRAPFVCGHELLAEYVRVLMSRPLILKLHRDVLLAPLNEPEQLEQPNERWAKLLKELFRHYTPIVIGYGGNDGTLMGLLEQLKPGEIMGGIFWCYRLAAGSPDERIQKVVVRHPGAIVPIVGFDEFMMQLGEKLRLPLIEKTDEIAKQGNERAESYRKQFNDLQESLKQPAEAPEAEEEKADVRGAVDRLIDRSTSWWTWELKASMEPDIEKRDRIYREGLKEFPESLELTNNYAVFVQDIRKDYDEAERLYKRALELGPNHAGITGNYALFLTEIRKDYDKAERLYKRALELDPNSAIHIGNYVILLKNIRKDYDEAERLYRCALELDPNDANNTGSYAAFLDEIRKDYAEAERLYKRALELDPNHANNTGNYAVFLHKIREDYDEAERLYKRALELDPNHANNTVNYATFLKNVRKDYDKAEWLYKRALELDPNNANYTGNYAIFLDEIRKDYDEAERLHKRALELDPNNANHTGNYAEFLIIQNRLPEARHYANRAWVLNGGAITQCASEVAFYRAILAALGDRGTSASLGRLKFLLQKGFPREDMTFDSLLQAVAQRLAPEDSKFFGAVADAILDENRVAELDSFPQWKSVEPIPPDIPWPEDE